MFAFLQLDDLLSVLRPRPNSNPLHFSVWFFQGIGVACSGKHIATFLPLGHFYIILLHMLFVPYKES